MRRLISSGSAFEAQAGYSRAVVDYEEKWAAPRFPVQTARILSIEDKDTSREILQYALSEAGYAWMWPPRLLPRTRTLARCPTVS
jgi:hypothetical protein